MSKVAGLHDLQGLLSVFRSSDGMALPLKLTADQVTVYLIVVNHEQTSPVDSIKVMPVLLNRRDIIHYTPDHG